MTSNLVLVTSSFPIRGDGSEAAGSFVSDLADQLAHHCSIRVVAPGPDSVCERWSKRIEVFRFAAPPNPLSTLRPWRFKDLRWIARVWAGGFKATQAATAGDLSHILALWGLPCGEWARRCAVERGIGYSVWLLGSDVWTLGRIPCLRGRLARVIQQATNAYADGYMLAESAARISGTPVAFLPSTRCIGTSGSIPPRRVPPVRFLFLGRWHPNKGVDLLLDALERLSDIDWNSIESVEIQGGGPLEPLVRQRVRSLSGFGRPVEAGRFLTKTEAQSAIERADWLLIPSRIESIPIIFSDSMKLGRPVISTPVGDLPRLVASGCGTVCERTDADAIADAIRSVARGEIAVDPVAIKRRADEFSVDSIMATILNGMQGQIQHAR